VTATPREGWYPDPTGAPATSRRWDGTQWTERTQMAPPPAFPVPAASPLTGYAFFVPWVIDMLFPLWDPMNQTLHDKATRTIVTKAPATGTPAP
jgi:hypothetical protein